MTSTEPARQPREVLRRIITELDDDLIRHRFDDPVDEVLRRFGHHAQHPIDQRAFNQIVAQVVGQVYRALQIPTTIANPLATAIGLLEQGYESGTYGRGYIPAMLDANSEIGEGVHGVVVSLGGLIKDRERQSYVRSVFAVHLPMTDWRLLCEIARVLLEDYRLFIPEMLARCAPAQLVDQIPSLMWTCLHTDSLLRNICFWADRRVASETVSS